MIDRVLGQLAGDTRLHRLIGRFRVQLLDDRERGDDGPPILQVPREDGAALPLPYGWCRG